MGTDIADVSEAGTHEPAIFLTSEVLGIEEVPRKHQTWPLFFGL